MPTNKDVLSFKDMNFVNKIRDKIIDLHPSFSIKEKTAHGNNFIKSTDFSKDQLWVILSSMAPANVPNKNPFIDTEYCNPDYTAGELGYLLTGWQFNLDLDYIVLSSQTEKDYGRILNELIVEGWKDGKYSTPTSLQDIYTHYNDIGPIIFATINPILRYLLTACRFHQATLECPEGVDNIPGHVIGSEEWRKLKLDYVKEVCNNFNKLKKLYNLDKIFIHGARMEAESFDVLYGNGIRIVVDFSLCDNSIRQMSFMFLYPPEYPKD